MLLKRRRLFFALGSLAVVVIALLISAVLKSAPPSESCPFCTTSVLKAQTFYEGDLVLGLCTHKPMEPGHCLIIPKRHVERFESLSNEEFLEICETISKVDTAAKRIFDSSAYLLLQKNGKEAGQSVPHVHFHYIPRKAQDRSVPKFFFQMIIANAKSPISSEKMEQTVQKMRSAITTQNAADAISFPEKRAPL